MKIAVFIVFTLWFWLTPVWIDWVSEACRYTWNEVFAVGVVGFWFWMPLLPVFHNGTWWLAAILGATYIIPLGILTNRAYRAGS